MTEFDLHSQPVLDAVHRLPETLKLIVTLRDYERVPPAQVAETLELSPDEVEQMHAEAYDQLRALIGQPAGSVRDACQLSSWTHADVVRACAAAYRAYEEELREHYSAYFAARPAEASSHPLLARDRVAAFASGWGSRVEDLVDPKAWHRWHLSGRSSHVLALDRRLLNEFPRPTTIDVYAEGSAGVLCLEAKFSESGMGQCSCEDRATGACAPRVLKRPYWDVARNVFGLDGPSPPQPCALSFAYQAVRNVAAALALSGPGRRAGFGLLYDANNPYFAGCGDWPGWSAVLETTLANSERIAFAAASWQELLPKLPLDETVRAWARDKHRLISD